MKFEGRRWRDLESHIEIVVYLASLVRVFVSDIFVCTAFMSGYVTVSKWNIVLFGSVRT